MRQSLEVATAVTEVTAVTLGTIKVNVILATDILSL
jgi:hypothetical protein